MKKPIIYILPGWSYNTGKWMPFISLLQKKGFSVIKLDIPGLANKLAKPFTLEDYDLWLESILSKEVEPVIIIGHSNGGRLALSFSSKHPEKISQLFLIDSAGIYHNELKIRIKRKIFKSLATIGKFLKVPNSSKTILHKFARESDYHKADEILKKTMINLISIDLKVKLPQIVTPTTIIWGELDKITPLSDGKILDNCITKSSLFIINGARHSPMFTHVHEVSKIVLNEIHI